MPPIARITAPAKAEADRVDKERSRVERERVYWDTQLRPALLKAIAPKARQTKITRTPVVTIAEAITGRHAELATWCGSPSTVDADHYAAIADPAGQPVVIGQTLDRPPAGRGE